MKPYVEWDKHKSSKLQILRASVNKNVAMTVRIKTIELQKKPKKGGKIVE